MTADHLPHARAVPSKPDRGPSKVEVGRDEEFWEFATSRVLDNRSPERTRTALDRSDRGSAASIVASLQQSAGNAAVQRWLGVNKGRELAREASAVPTWEQFPEHAQSDLTAAGYGKAWFVGRSALLTQTVLNLYIKLKGMSLWPYVGADVSSGIGTLEFACPNMLGLKKTLTDRSDFTSPEKSETVWSSREKRAEGQLHFKHFKGWEPTRVQAHIDPQGLLLHNPLMSLVPVPVPGSLVPVPLGAVQALRHGVTWLCEAYKDVFIIRDQLLSQGWDAETLMGTASKPSRGGS